MRRQSFRANRFRCFFRPRLTRLESRTVPTVFTVTNTNDSGAGSLRQAVIDANTAAGADSIVFDATAFATPQTVLLTTGEMSILGPVTVTGPGQLKLTVSASATASSYNRIFNISMPSTVVISDLTLANAAVSTGNGGAIYAAAGSQLSLANVTLTNNKTLGASDLGGGVYLYSTATDATSLTLTNVTATNCDSGVVCFRGSQLKMTNCDFHNNSNHHGASNVGGAVSVFGSSTTTISNSIFRDNIHNCLSLGDGSNQISKTTIAGTSGAGIVMYEGKMLTVTDSIFDGNDGGGIYAGGSVLTVAGSTFIHNQHYRGGAIETSFAMTVIKNSTFVENTASSFGTDGGGAIKSSGNLSIYNTTIVNNRAYGQSAGGIQVYSGNLTLQSTIVAGNLGNGFYDIAMYTPGSVSGTNNLIGVGDIGGFTLSQPNQNGTMAAPLNPLISVLADNGGATKTFGLLPGSPAIDKGNNVANLTTDQRGTGFPRVLNGTADVGAFEFEPSIPSAVMTPIPPITTPNSTAPNSILVTYSDAAGIDVATIDIDDIQIIAPDSSVVPIGSAEVDLIGIGSPRKATYTFLPPGGTWNGVDAGDFTIKLKANQVANADGKYAREQIIGLVRVSLPKMIVVNATNDEIDDTDGKLSLREALAMANFDETTTDTIAFDAAVVTGSTTIKLANGALNINSDMVISGPGADQLAIDAQKLSNVFDIVSERKINVTLAGITITNGSYFDGGGISADDENITLDGVWLKDNFGAYRSGAVGTGQANLKILNSTVSGNSTGGSGPGAGIYMVGGPTTYLLIRNSTISNNTASTSGRGAVFYLNGYQNGTVIRIENSTLTENHSGGDGGAIWASATPGANVITIESSIIAGNTAGTGTGADIFAGTVTAKNSFIGVSDSGFILNKQGTTIAGTKNSPANPQLGPLQNNGGHVPTHLPSLASNVRDIGSNPSGLQYDQRGIGFPRSLQGGVDIGAVERDSNNPTAFMKGIDSVWKTGSIPNTIEVTYKDATAIDWTTIDISDIQLLNPNSIPLLITGVSLDANVNGAVRVATYTFSVPGGGWDLADNGNYTVLMMANQVQGTGGIAVAASTLGSFSVSFGKSFIVSNTADAGVGSLRQAILNANASVTVGPDTVTFAVGGTITLVSDLIITDAVEIKGPGASTLAITRMAGGHIIYATTNNIEMTVSGLTLRDSHSDNAPSRSGAAILSAGTLTVRDCVLSGNGASVGIADNGGAIAHSGTLLLERSTFQNNFVYGLGGAVSAGPIVTIRDCTFTGNQELGAVGIFPPRGGAVWASGTVLIEGSTFNGNSGSFNRTSGGALAVAGDVVIRNSTFYGNFSNDGGAIYVAGGTTTMQHCTVTGNSAYDGPTYTGYGGGIQSGGTLILQSTIVSNNTDADAPDIIGGTVQADHSAIGSLTGISTYIDNGNNLPAGTNLQLGSFGNYGGLTKTIPLLAGSPAINAGSNPGGVAIDQRGTGYYRVIGKAADIGAFEYQNLPAVISSVHVNDGSPQRSRVTSLTVTFDRPVAVSANSFQLIRQSDGASVSLSASVLGSSVILSFTGGAVEFGSLADGRYTLTAFAALINGGNFDGNGDTVAGDNYNLIGTPANGLFRLFGDSHGNGRVNGTDFIALRTVFGLGATIFDFNGDGQTNSSDIVEFRKRFGLMI